MSNLGIRIVGFLACLVISGYVAIDIFLQIMIGDCDAGDAGKYAACEAARSKNLLVLVVVALLIVALLTWAFFFAGRRKGRPK